MKTAGIVGGIGPESTIDYYRHIISGYRERTGSSASPSILIDSLDTGVLLGHLGANRVAAATDYLSQSIDRLIRGGATFAAMAANTPHLVFDEVQRGSSIPLVSIVEATCREVTARGMRKVALFGTRFTMRGHFYPSGLSQAGVELAMPSSLDQDYIHQKYVSELLNNQFLPATRDGLVAIITRMRDRDGIEGLILAGTELPLVLRGAEVPGVPFLDTPHIHVRAIVDELVKS